MLLIYQLSQTVIRDLLLAEAFIIPPNADSYLPNQPYIQDPYFRNLELMVFWCQEKLWQVVQLIYRDSRPDYEILVRRYGKTVCTTFKEVV